MNWEELESHLLDNTPSNVYLLRSGDYYKIGIADNTQSRIRELQTGNPVKIELVHSMSAPRAKCAEFERSCHDWLHVRGLHVRGEWFTLPDEVLSEIIAHMDTGELFEIPVVNKPKKYKDMDSGVQRWFDIFHATGSIKKANRGEL